MLIEVDRDLQRDGKRIVLARQVGQARDILTAGRRPATIQIFPSVRAAVDALPAEGFIPAG